MGVPNILRGKGSIQKLYLQISKFEYASFGTKVFWEMCVVKYLVPNIGYMHLPNKYISLVNNYLIITHNVKE
jgi:hypothetical protein